MTLCNLNIEMGGRSGFVAPDDEHVRLDRRPAVRAAGRACGSTRSRIGARSRATTTPKFDSRACARLREPRAADHLGHRSEPGASAFPAACPTRPPSDAEPARGDGERARLYGARRRAWRSRACRSTACSSAPAPTPPARPAGRRRGGARPPRRRRAWSRWSCPAPSTVKRAAEAEGLDKVFRDAGFFWGESGCSMCAGGNGDRGEPGERMRLHHQPQFREPPGAEGAHASRQPGDRGGDRDRRPHRRRAAAHRGNA